MLLLQIPQLYLLGIILLGLLHLLLPHVQLCPLLLRPESLIQGLELHASLAALEELLRLAVLVLVLLHLVVLEHAPVHEHVHVALQEGRPQALVRVVVQLLLHGILLHAGLTHVLLVLHLLLHVLEAGEKRPFVQTWLH